MLAIRNLSDFYIISYLAWNKTVKQHWVDFSMLFVNHSPQSDDEFFSLLAVNRLCYSFVEEDKHGVIPTISVLVLWLVCLADWVAVIPY